MASQFYRSMNAFPVLCGVLFWHLLFIGELCAQGLSLTATRIDGAISLDGILDEPEWLRPGTLVLIQREPQEGLAGSEATEAWFAYDDNALYVAVRLHDSAPDSILGRLIRRDDDFQSDFVYIGLDPKLDRNTGYYFGTNPSGSINDGIIYDDNKTDASYDPIWYVAVSVDRQGWTAEFRIPFSQLRFQEADEYTWGVDIYRRIHRKSEEELMTLHPRSDDIRVSRFSTLKGLRGFRPPPRIEILPYVAATGKFLPSPPLAAFNQGRTDPFIFGRDLFGTVGADAKIGLSGDFTLDASINPDFAQVEVDPAIVNLTAYETYYAEKRPFFIEGSGILSFGRGGAASFIDYNWGDPGFFYSRRIGRAPHGTVSHDGFMDTPDRTTILGAAKVSGKTSDGWSLAALTALTDREYGKVDSAGTRFQEEVEPLTFYGVLRGQKQFNESRQSLGIIGTYVERNLSEPQLQGLLGQRAFSLGIDGWTFLDESKDWVVNGWSGITYVSGSSAFLQSLQESPTHWFQKPDAGHVSVDSAATSLSGWAGRAWLSRDKGNWRFSAAFGLISPGFESNDLGFHTYTDVVNMSIYSGYLWFQPDAVFRTKSVSVAGLREYNFGGDKTGETYYLSADGEFHNYWGGAISLGYNLEVLDDKRTRGGPLMKSLPSRFASISAYTDSRKDLYGSVYLSGDRGESGGWDYDISVSMNWKLTTAFNLSFGPSFSRNHLVTQFVEAIPDAAAVQTYGTRYVFGLLDRKTMSADLRLNWTFTPRASLQVYLQPYLSAGHYSGFRSLARPSSYEFDPYAYASDPDFNFRSLKANAVFRWEYLPGSTLYIVWTNEKANYEEQNGSFSLTKDFLEMLRARPANVFSVKLTYWWAP